MSNQQEITQAIVAAQKAQKSRPEWTGSWYAIGRAIRELEHAIGQLPFETAYEKKSEPADSKATVRHRNGTVCLDPEACAELNGTE